MQQLRDRDGRRAELHRRARDEIEVERETCARRERRESRASSPARESLLRGRAPARTKSGLRCTTSSIVTVADGVGIDA